MVRSELEGDRPEPEKDHHRREKDRRKEKDRRDRDLDRERDKARDREKERDREKDKEKDRDREKDKEKDRDRDRDKDKDRERDREKDKEKEKERDRDKEKEKERDRDQDKIRDRERDVEKLKERDREKYRDKGREKEKEKEKEKKDKDRDRSEKERLKDRERDRDRERERDRDRLKEKEREREKDKEREKNREKDASRNADKEKEGEYGKERRKEKDKRDWEGEKEKDRDREKEKDRDRERDKDRAKDRDRERDRDFRVIERDREREREHERKEESERDQVTENELSKQRDQEQHKDALPLEGGDQQKHRSQDSRKGKLDPLNEVADWVNKSRKLEDQKKIEERIKAARMARMLAEQDSGKDSDSEEESGTAYSGKDLAGLKVLHGVDKVMEGSAVVLTLKDRNILAGDDVNDEMDELENLELAQQRTRDEAYKAAKKKAEGYEDKFQNDINAVRTVLPQYDDEMQEAGMTLDETGGLDEESRRKLEELKLKLGGVGARSHVSLAGGASVASDFYTQEEMLQFNKPKKKKKMRKKEALDLDALEAEAKAEGLGADDLGSRVSDSRKAMKQEQAKAAEESRKSAYFNAYTKAVEASKKLQTQTVSDRMAIDMEETFVFGTEEDDELSRSLERARKAALKKQTEEGGFSTGPQSVVAAIKQLNENDNEKGPTDDSLDRDKAAVVFTETEEFCRSLQLDEVIMKRPVISDAFGTEDIEGPVEEDRPLSLDGGWMEVKEETERSELQVEDKDDDDTEIDDATKEVAIGKGLAGALQLLKERGSLKETVEWGGRNMDKKKSKLIGIVGQEEKFRNREILLDRVDEFGRTMTPKESFRKLSHKFHGKGPGKLKQEKRMKQYQEELKLKQMNSGDTPLLSMEKMREAQAKMHTPYIVISGHIKPGQTSDPRSGFATVEKEFIGSLTPMLGDKKVEHFLGIKRKPEGGSMGPPPPKKPKTQS